MLGWSLRLGSLLGVPIFVHWTFLLLLGWLMAGPLMSGGSGALAASLRTGGFVIAVFACVLLHEMGHALAARRYGVRTRDIVLLPIGGVARLESMPRKPVQELVVALAGPAVNVLIAMLIIPAVVAVDGLDAFSPPAGRVHHAHFLGTLGAVNLMLVAFNAIPAFPMDGGRVLRAILAMIINRSTATRIATVIGQLVAVGFAIFGMYTGQFMMLLVALFVFTAARAEARAEQFASAIRGIPVRRAMTTAFTTVRESQTVGDVLRDMLATPQQDFLVLADDAVSDEDAAAITGVLTRHDVVRVMQEGRHEVAAGAIMRPVSAFVEETDDLQRVFERLSNEGKLQSGEVALIPVVRPTGSPGGLSPRAIIVGVITPHTMGELLSAMRHRRGTADRQG